VTPDPTVTAIVPATDRPPTLDRCVGAIRAGSSSPEQLLVITEPPGAGPALARNRGADRAEGDVLAFVDADVVVHSDAIARIRAAFAADPGLTAVFGSYDDSPEAPGAISGFRNLLHHHVHQHAAGRAMTFWAGLGAIRRDAFLAAGGFDAGRYPLPSVEDIELGMRLSAAGARIVLDPGLLGTHLKSWSLAEVLRTDFARRGVPWAELLARPGSPTDVLNLGWRHRLSAVVSIIGAGAIVLRRPLVALTAAALLVGINRRFYALLLRRRGGVDAAAGIGLHALHHLTASVALAVGVARALRSRR
jgi:GT2 family glycosyltransferase